MKWFATCIIHHVCLHSTIVATYFIFFPMIIIHLSIRQISNDYSRTLNNMHLCIAISEIFNGLQLCSFAHWIFCPNVSNISGCFFISYSITNIKLELVIMGKVNRNLSIFSWWKNVQFTLQYVSESYYLNQWRPSYVTSYGVNRTQWVR